MKYASENIKSDREIVYEAVKQNWCNIDLAPEELLNDHFIVYEVVT